MSSSLALSIDSKLSAFHWETLPTALVGKKKIGKIIFDTPHSKVNKFNQAVMHDFEELLKQLQALGQQHQLEALVLFSKKPGNFIAGADLEWIQSAQTQVEAQALSQKGQSLLNLWEDLPFPTIVAIEGAALGGGCELSLASTAIVMSSHPQARIGLPEVLLGFVPGMGGCLRLPQKIGLAQALDFILSGKTVSGEKAFQVGLAEAFLPWQNFETSVIQWVLMHLEALQQGKRLAKVPRLGKIGGLLGTWLESPLGRPTLFRQTKAEVLKRTRGHYPAPLEAVAVLEEMGTHYGSKKRGPERAKALQIEAKAFSQLAVTEISQHLVRLFFLTEKTKKEPVGLGAFEAARIEQAAVLGAGVMGGGIAQLFAEKNISVRMKDLNLKALQLGMKQASSLFEKQQKQKRISQRDFFQKMNAMTPQLDHAGFGKLQVVVEAVVENLEIKKKVLAAVEAEVPPECVLASNTSSLSISEMQKALQHPERFGGMHFFNPVHKMPLVEVVRGNKTSDLTVLTLVQLSKRLGKTPIIVKDAAGFLVNRLLLPYLNEATYLVQEGVPIEDLDRALLAFGMPMGPLELLDEIGIDVGEKVSHILYEAFGERMRPCSMNPKLIQAGRLGKKNGKGFYHYVDGKKKANAEVYGLLFDDGQPPVTSLPREHWVERCLLPMINEACRCLDEGVVQSPEEVDLGMLMGTGFPAFRGGLLRYAEALGVAHLLKRLDDYQHSLGARFEPSAGLLKRGEQKRPFFNSK